MVSGITSVQSVKAMLPPRPLRSVEQFLEAIKSGRADILQQLEQPSAGRDAVILMKARFPEVFDDANATSRNILFAGVRSALRGDLSFGEAKRLIACAKPLGPCIAARLYSKGEIQSLALAIHVDAIRRAAG